MCRQRKYEYGCLIQDDNAMKSAKNTWIILFLICIFSLIALYYFSEGNFYTPWSSRICNPFYELCVEANDDGIDESWMGDNLEWTAYQIQCYVGKGNKFPTLQRHEPKIGKAIFFHETLCPENLDDVSLRARQACAVESAALHHPDKDVFLLFVAPIMSNLTSTKNVALKALLEYSNIHPRHIHFLSYLRGTKMERLLPLLQQSHWAAVHASDILRYVTLNKYKGTYLDLDVIITKPLPERNYVGAESEEFLGSGVINFGDDDVGTEMAELCADDISSLPDFSDWGNSGPKVVTRVLYDRCHVERTLDLWNRTCKGFKVWPPSAFYPIPYQQHQVYFVPWGAERVQRIVDKSYLIHYWGKFTSQMPINDPKQPIYSYVKENCPKVFNAVNGVL